MDRVAAFLSEKTPRRFIAITAFVAVLYLFRHLALLLVFFVAFERMLGWGSRTMVAQTGIGRKKAVLLLVLGMVGAFGLAAWAGVGKTLRAIAAAQFPERLADLRKHPLIEKLQDQVGGTEKIVEGIKHYAGDAISAASAVGHFFVYVLIGLILATVYTLEEEELAAFWARVDTRSLGGTLGRWLGHVADSAIVTVQLQLVVAAFNTVTTLPVLLILGVQRDHVGPLMVLVFASALVPVIGNVVSGAVLALLAYQANGWWGVGIFAALTFILHKIESYYLSPRLTARHVKLPGFLLIVSLLLCEHLFGFKGLFLSFPILFVASRIRGEFREEDAIVSSPGSALVLTDSPDQLPGHHNDVYADEEAPTGIELERARIPLDSVRPGPAAAGQDVHGDDVLDDDDDGDHDGVKPASTKSA